MIEFEKLKNHDFKTWNDYVLSHPDSEIFHLAEWYHIYKESYNYKPWYYFLKDNSAIKGIIPLFHQKGLFKNILVSPPAGILLDDNNKYNESILDFIKSLKSKTKATDVIFYNNYNLSPEMNISNENVRVLKQLPASVEDLDKDIGKKRRWGVKKANQTGFHHEVIVPTKKDINVFYKIYGINYRDLGTPVHSKRFFYMQAKYLKDYLRLFFVYNQNDKPICVKLLYNFKSTLTSNDSATLRKYFHTRINDYQIYHALAYAIKNKFSTYNMGRSQKESGTYIFKKSWGKTIVEEYPVYSFHQQSGIKNKKSKYNSIISIWKKTPVFITNIAGPLVRKNLNLD